ncbi:PREDICTED: S-norcoclaurine synthase-like isoform X2 [Fragaria vesca subsp. vesca]|uniref:S-norcoclaurine synthase-like isoform X2 n=1 Tax=Fragaria vesca subsp. vesca TaxID=101020 RepID=UPI0002C35F21|nr:PREDICTED: S-norcoclaurine synthase-like isoform X2 [Fragaria vesca subsp. vesca]
MVVGGQVTHELEVQVSASQAWELISTLELAKLIQQTLTDVVEKIEVVQGDGQAGTILRITCAPGVPGPGWQTEKFTVVDNEKRVKVAEVIEGGYLELGFTLFRVRAEIIECSSSSCIIKSSLEYELKEEAAANVAIDSLVSAHPFAKIAEIAKNHLLLQNENNRDYDA